MPDLDSCQLASGPHGNRPRNAYWDARRAAPPEAPGETLANLQHERPCWLCESVAAIGQENPMTDTEYAEPPPRRLLLWEARAFWEHGAFVAAFPWLGLLAGGRRPSGSGASRSRRQRSVDGADACVSAKPGLRGVRLGLGPQSRLAARSDDARKLKRLREIRERHGRKVSLIGWSLGRHLRPRGRQGAARRREAGDHARQSVQRPSRRRPARGGSTSSSLATTSTKPALAPICPSAPPVPTTSIFSRSDGIVAWQCCMENDRAHTENVEVCASHCGLGANPSALYAIADRLTQPEGCWRPFDRRGLRRLIFPDPWRGAVRDAA